MGYPGDRGGMTRLRNLLLTLLTVSLSSSQETTIDLIEAAGRTAETHYVTTEDGYILAVHRMPAPGGQPVLYLHGYESSSAEIVLRGEDSLGFLLADEGYDVWMLNFRGNAYSRNHTVLDPDNSTGTFWGFTWWEMGTEDLPAAMSWVLDTTEAAQLQVLGHSQGMTALYVMLDQHPELASKIKLISGMAPLSYNSHTQGLLRWCTEFLTSVPVGISQIEFLRPSPLLHLLTDIYCNENSTAQETCYDILFLVTGFDLAQQDRGLLTTQLRHFPSGTSGRVIVHHAQMILTGTFQAFDWGEEGNFIAYNRLTPPSVNLSRVTPPHALYVAEGNDYLAQPADYNQLIAELPNVVKVHTVASPLWNHMDFLIGRDAPRLLYPHILAEMGEYP